MELNVFNNLKDTTVSKTISITDWLNHIQKGRYSDYVNYLRTLTEKNDIDKFKAEELNCVVYNFNLNKKRNSENIVSATGYFFIDIDVPFDTRLLNRSKIYALYKSCTGKGIHIIVQVDGLNQNNYDDAYTFIINTLGIEQYVDKCAKGKIQAALISYDPNLFHNPNSFVFDLSRLVQSVPQGTLSNKTSKKETFRQPWGTVERINFNCANDMEFDNGDYIADWQNIDFIECRLTGKIKEGKRNKTLFAYGANLVYLNPTLTKEKLTAILHNVNIASCDMPLEYKDIASMMNTLFKYKQEGKLTPLYKPKKRSIVFNPDAKLSYDEKMVIVHSIQKEKCAEESKTKIYDIIENWDFEAHKLISVRNISNNYPISKKTVAKYYSEFKDYIQELNMTHKLS